MINVINEKTLPELMLAPPETVGPNSAFPFLAINGAVTLNPEDAAWLRQAPCPIIAIGEGPTADACDTIVADEKSLFVIARNISAAPQTALTLVQLLRMVGSLSLDHSLTAESLAYATVQQGAEFKAWRKGYAPNPAREAKSDERVDVEVTNKSCAITLNSPATRNEMTVNMRDALCAALDVPLLDRSIEHVRFSGVGACFSIGGAIDEFGTVADPLYAHWIRSVRLPARRLAKLSQRLHVHVNGAAIGAGVEMAAFGNRVTAAPNAWFQLPELKYGLIPGAGGAVSLSRRIGRQRTGYLALSMKRITAKTAHQWGLVDDIFE
ncbi:MAG: enoyl-CoA hydratase/isomerase family protein [Pseudomonadota bacterium]